jgi:hypothetical protein
LAFKVLIVIFCPDQTSSGCKVNVCFLRGVAHKRTGCFPLNSAVEVGDDGVCFGGAAPSGPRTVMGAKPQV